MPASSHLSTAFSPTTRTMTLLSGIGLGLNHTALVPSSSFSLNAAAGPHLPRRPEPHNIMLQVLGPMLSTARIRSTSANTNGEDESSASIAANSDSSESIEKGRGANPAASGVDGARIEEELAAPEERTDSRPNSPSSFVTAVDTAPYATGCSNHFSSSSSSTDDGELAHAAENLTISRCAEKDAGNPHSSTSAALTVYGPPKRNDRACAFLRSNSLDQARGRLAAARRRAAAAATSAMAATTAKESMTPPPPSDEEDTLYGVPVDLRAGDLGAAMMTTARPSSSSSLSCRVGSRALTTMPSGATITPTAPSPHASTAGAEQSLPWYVTRPPPTDDTSNVSFTTLHFSRFTWSRPRPDPQAQARGVGGGETGRNRARRSLRELRVTGERCRRAEDHFYGWVGGWCRERAVAGMVEGDKERRKMERERQQLKGRKTEGSEKEENIRNEVGRGVVRTLREKIARLVKRGRERKRKAKREARR